MAHTNKRVYRDTRVHLHIKEPAVDASPRILHNDQAFRTHQPSSFFMPQLSGKFACSGRPFNHDLGVHLLRLLGRRRSGTPRITEHVHSREPHFFAECERLFKVLIGLPRKAHDKVGS